MKKRQLILLLPFLLYITAVNGNNCTINVISEISCYGSDDGILQAIPPTGASNPVYQWGSTSQNQTTATASGLAVGTHSITITDDQGNTSTCSVTLSQPNSLSASVSTVDVSVPCINGSDGKATAAASGGTMPYSYLWSNGATTASISDLTTGLYSVTVTDDNDCMEVISCIGIKEPKRIDFSVTPILDVSCHGLEDGSAFVFVGGGAPPYQFDWDNGESSDTAVALNAGGHFLVITDNNNCVDFGKIQINQPDLLTIATQTTTVSCPGNSDGTITASPMGGTPPYFYTWDANANNQTTPTATGLAIGTYSVTVTDDNGCTADRTANVIKPDALVINLENDSTSCFGYNNGTATALVAGGVQPYTYLWSDGQITQTASNLGTGTWQVTVTDANLCTITGMTTIGQPLKMIPTLSITNEDCNTVPNGSAQVSITNGVPPFAFSWNTGSTNSSITDLSAGSYTVSITDQNGCCVIASAIVNSACDSCELAINGVIDICLIIASDSTSSLATLDCDNGGVNNAIECSTGNDPTTASDDCMAAELSGLDVCAIISKDNSHPLASLDCDSGGVSNLIECQNNFDPFDPSDDCSAATQAGLNICSIINYDPSHPLSSIDCDEGGVNNYLECINGEDPVNPTDDCEAAVDAGLDICLIIGSGNHPWASLDCDQGGIDNQTECASGGDPSDPADDKICPVDACELAIDNQTDICLLLSTDPNHELATLDCDNGGVINQVECANGGNPLDASDDCIIADTLELNICTFLIKNPNHPSATADCDNGGIDNLTECNAGADPFNPSDDCNVALTNNLNICMLIQFDPNHPLAMQDCDEGGIANWVECQNGGNPADSTDDCEAAIEAGTDICQLLANDPSNALATLDCDQGGVDNQTECTTGNNPSDKSDDCDAALSANLDICTLIAVQPNHPLANEDCDGGGVANAIECSNNGNPADASDDCAVALDAEIDICALLLVDPNQALAQEDCDNGGISNIKECMAGTNPAQGADDCIAAIHVQADICTILSNNPNSGLATADCDNGGITNLIECNNGGDPSNAADDCSVAVTTQTDICALLDNDPNHPLASQDCDGGGVDNGTECAAQGNPLEASDECSVAILAQTNICQLIAYDNSHPLATLDCDSGGIDNYTECINGGDPGNAMDDCEVASGTGFDLCAEINNDPAHPWASLDCDNGGVDNITECLEGKDPSHPSDDISCDPDICDLAELGELDLCVYITSNPQDSIRFEDCDGGGLANYLECIFGSNPLDPVDDCGTAIGANINICALMNNDIDHPFSMLDCDNGGINNYIECSIGKDPRNPIDDCQAALDPNVNICALIVYAPSHPLSTSDCDNGGIDNYTECINGNDPQDPADDCALAVDEQIDICVILANSTVYSALQFLDCDGDGVINITECADTTNPVDPCDFVDTSITLPVTADQSECSSVCSDLTPVSTIAPGNISGVSTVGYAVQITELNGLETDGSAIKVRIPSDPRLVFTWDPNLTNVAFTTVNNSDWLYQGNNNVFHVFQYIGNHGVLNGNDITAFGYEAVYDPQATNGQTTITATLVPFSGGECNLFNNSDSERLVYFD